MFHLYLNYQFGSTPSILGKKQKEISLQSTQQATHLQTVCNSDDFL